MTIFTYSVLLKNKQRGWILSSWVYALLIFFSLLLLGDFFTINSEENSSKINSFYQLQQIRQALIAWSVNSNNPGMLPCPEDISLIGTINEGSAQSSCSNQNNFGRLPWRTLGLGKIRDSHGDAFWYFTAGGFSRSPVNSNNIVNLTLDGLPMVALIASPGVPTSGQSRALGVNDIKQFFENNNADNNAQFNTLRFCSGCNDLILGLTSEQLFAAVHQRVLQEIRGNPTQGLIKFWGESAHYPFADINQDGVADEASYQGYVPYSGDTNSLVFYSPSAWLKKIIGFTSLLINLVVISKKSN